MPQQLIYTSAPRGIVAGRSGHCTVARSAAMREALMLQLEKVSYYQHLSLRGGQERPIFSGRIVDIRGSRFHVLSRIQDAGLDFTGRTNFIAHHLVFTPEEIRQNAMPPVVLRHWPGWVKSWTKEPQLLENEDWSGLAALAGKSNVPAQTWHRVTGDAVNGYGLLEARAGASFRVDDQTDETVLELIAESLELLDLRDPRKDFRATAWQYTFTTSMQEQDKPADFRWRCLHSDNPAGNRFATPDCRALSAVRAAKWTREETVFARAGRQPPRFVTEPQDVRISEGEAVRFAAQAEGIPGPSYQWFSVDRAHSSQVLPGETNSELVVSNPVIGISRYVVSITNSVGNAQSRVATLSVKQKWKLAQARIDTSSNGPATPARYNLKTADDIERQRRRLNAEQAQEIFYGRQRRNKIMKAILAAIVIVAAGIFVGRHFANSKPAETPSSEVSSKKNDNESRGASSITKKDCPLSSSQGGLPDGWTKTSIGSVQSPYTECITNAATPPRFDLSGAAEGFHTNGDNVLFVSTANITNVFQATLLNKSNITSTASRCGIMMRGSTNSDSPFLFIGVSSERIYVYGRANKSEFIFWEAKIPTGNLSKPVSFRFQQKDNHVIPQYSYDSTNWFGSNTNFSYENRLALVGLAICSGNPSSNVVAQFVVSPTVATDPGK
jgi:hypothetical protein